MAEPFLGEIRQFSFSFAPRGWALCNGQLLNINQNQALYALLGTTYGGNGTTNFALPDLRGRVPVHWGNGVTFGQKAGAETHTLTVKEMPAHNHLAIGTNTIGDTRVADKNYWAQNNSTTYAMVMDADMSAQALAKSGGSLPHQNMQPYTVVNFCIALQGIFPTRN
ncbi:phage tail protein [Brevibacillus sp. 179-C9.3 HS]|uniref:phage tail protein n=1 Tax=unclassified Brevibacillus TaxID=2684853 RepID=UPI0039A33BDE